jgi:hypothetical protein
LNRRGSWWAGQKGEHEMTVQMRGWLIFVAIWAGVNLMQGLPLLWPLMKH